MATTYEGFEIAGVLDGTEIVPITQAGELKQTTTQNVIDLLSFDLPLSLSTNVLSIPQADALNDGYLSAADFATFSGTASWAITGNDIYNSNIGNVGVGITPSGTHKFEVLGGILSSDEASFQGITIRNKSNAIAIGTNMMAQAAIPTNSTFLGGYAGANVTGIHNTAVGYTAMYNATGPAGSVAVGWNAMRYRTAGNYNTAVGYQAMGTGLATGAANTGIGRNSLINMTTGYQNTCVGSSSGGAIIGGGDNTLIGYLAGGNLTEGLRNIILGSNTTASAVSVNDELNIGGWLKGTAGRLAIGGGLPSHASVQFEVTSITTGSIPFPIMTQAQRLAIATPALGLHVYQSDGTEGVYVNKSGGWAFAY